MDYTGTGNTLNMQHPRVLQLVMDSLRYFATECRVDGFRFDLGAPAKRASTRVKVPPVQLDGSAPKTVPTASP